MKNFLLKAYYGEDGHTEKIRRAENWYPYHDAIGKRHERTLERLDLLECIINERKTD